MKKIARYFPRTIVSKFLVGLAIFLSLSGSVRSQGQGLRVIDVTAKKYEYSPKFNSRSQLPTTIMVSDLVLFPMGQPIVHPG